VSQAIILYEAALGLGIAVGPLVGGVLGGILWRGPFFGVSVLMAIGLAVTAFLLPATPPTGRPTSILDPFRALRHRGLLGVAVTALLYNFGFFTLLAFTPFPLDMGAHAIGLIFFGWGLCVAFASVVAAPRLQRRFGTVPTLLVNLTALSALLAVMAIGTDSKVVLAVCVVVAGLFLGINNTLVTETVMKAAPVDRGVASAAYSFVRFSGGAVAPFLAGKLGEDVSVHAPFWVGAGAVLLGVLAFTNRYLTGIDDEESDDTPRTTDLHCCYRTCPLHSPVHPKRQRVRRPRAPGRHHLLVRMVSEVPVGRAVVCRAPASGSSGRPGRLRGVVRRWSGVLLATISQSIGSLTAGA